jgi:tetratricopeptide (TPR) repeat protein
VELALMDNRRNAPARTWPELYHELNGEYAEARELSNHLLVDFPLYWPAHLDLGEALRQQGDTRGAIREFERVLEQDNHNVFALASLMRTYVDSDDFQKALQTLERARPEDRENYLLRIERAILRAREGRSDEALREMDMDVQKYAEINPLLTVRIAGFYSVMKEPDKALQWLDKAVRLGDDRENLFRRDPLMAGIRTTPRFEAVVALVANRRQQLESGKRTTQR